MTYRILTTYPRPGHATIQACAGDPTRHHYDGKLRRLEEAGVDLDERDVTAKTSDEAVREVRRVLEACGYRVTVAGNVSG